MKKRILLVVMGFFALALFAYRLPQKFWIDPFLELGIPKPEADQFIADNFFNSSLSFYMTDQIKKMPQARRAALVKTLGDYIRAYVESSAFTTKYKEERDAYMALSAPMQSGPTREEMIANFIESLQRDEAEIMRELKTATGSKKTELDEALKQVREALAALKDIRHPQHKKYFDLMKEELMPDQGKEVKYDDPAEAKAAKEALNMMGIDEDPFPATPREMVVKRLKEFIEVSGSVDFNAKVEKRGSKLYFVDEKYEQKSDTWKKMYRCGKEVLLPARAYAQQWLATLK